MCERVEKGGRRRGRGRGQLARVSFLFLSCGFRDGTHLLRLDSKHFTGSTISQIPNHPPKLMYLNLVTRWYYFGRLWNLLDIGLLRVGIKGNSMTIPAQALLSDCLQDITGCFCCCHSHEPLCCHVLSVPVDCNS